MKAITEAQFLGQEGAWFRFGLSHGMEARITFLEADLARVVFRHESGFRLDRGWAIAPNRSEPDYAGRNREDLSGFTLPPAVMVPLRDGCEITAGDLVLSVRLSPFGLSWRRKGEREPFLTDRPTQAYLVSRKTGAFSHFVARNRDDRHYGLGDKSGRLDKTGRRFRIDSVDPCGFDAETSDPLYKMIPFYIVQGQAGAHGLFYDNLATASVDFGATLDNYHGLFRSYQADDGDLDYYVFAGPAVADVTRRFSWLTGGQAFPPRWSLGFGMTSMAIADADDADHQISLFLAKCHEHGIPCRSFHFGSGYSMHNRKRYAFRWNHDKFPDPAATMARIEAAGMRAITNLKPCLLDDHPRLGEVSAALVQDESTGTPAVAQFWDGLGYHLDFTAPAGRAWWRAGMETTLLGYGVTTIWNDNNEYEIWDEDAVCAGDGQPFRQILARPAQALLMTKLASETQSAHAPGERPYNITRAGSAGLWRYGQTWSGDNATAWKTLRFNLSQGLTMVLSGMYNTGHDVGGFHGPRPGPELLVRFAEFCCLWPRFVMNSWNDDGITTVPWLYPEVLPEIRAAMQLRERLMPLIYTLMWQAAIHDEPAIRPLLWHWPDDAQAVNADDVFMLGPDVIVAPVLEEGATTRAVYLPAHPGGWICFHTARVYAGGHHHTVPGPLGTLPLFVRNGAVLPLADGEGKPVAVAFGQPADDGCDVYLDNGVATDWQTRPLVRLPLAQ
jgi:alpha-glucosidase